MKGWTKQEIENLARNSKIAGWTGNDVSYGKMIQPMPPDRHTSANIPLAHKPSKYRNQKTAVDGIPFDSKKEAARYQELKIMERAGIITELELQPEYDLSVNHKPVCKYRADFAYILGGVRIVEDVKGMKTDVYRIKNKLMKAIYNIEIKEI